MKKNILVSAITASTLAFFAGCASKVEAPKNSGFFQSYKEFENSSYIVTDAQKLSKYEKIYVEDVKVIPAIALQDQTKEQKKLYTEISKYATARLKENLGFKNSDKKSNDTLVMSSALSASEVHFDDKEWNQLSPLALGITVVSLNAYLDQSARLVGEYRLDANEDTLVRSLKLIKKTPITLQGDFLTMDDIKNSIDAWAKKVASEINKGVK